MDDNSFATFDALQAKYAAERDKRLTKRPQGEAQSIDLTTSTQFRHLQDDPWIAADAHTTVPTGIDLANIKYLVIGAGYTGLLFAVRLLDAGVRLQDIAMVDPAGGFGGVWYWNRYPGLMCDVESYIYMPLLEETGYMPRHKYAYGSELRAHGERIADHWGLRERTVFRQQVKHLQWDAEKAEWAVETRFAGDRRELDLRMRAKFVMLAGGQATRPKIPVVPGFDSLKIPMFHTSRWDYGRTGGSSDEVKPELGKLKDLRVGIIGTGATAIQVVPELAKYSKELYVFQRTPSSVDVRNQRETDPKEWKKITEKKGWWWDRNANFAGFLHHTQPEPAENLVSDGWVVDNPSYCACWGYDQALTLDQVPGFVGKLQVDDVPRANRLRQRVDTIVKDKATAEKLKHWYPSWCKRPCFHDDFLPAFNRRNVTLVDTNGHGVDRFTEDGIVANGTEYKLDLLILSTGYKVLGGSASGSPAFRYDMTIVGQDGRDMDAAFEEELTTLHGLCRAGFPNLFWSGAQQASLTANQMMSQDTFARHAAYIVTEGERRANADRVVIQPTKAAQDVWGDKVAEAALGLSATAGCTPNYFNLEGELDRMAALGPEVQAKMQRGQIWGRGIIHYSGLLDEWKKEGQLQGFEIRAAS